MPRKPVTLPARARITVTVARGDLTLSSETTAAHAEATATFLVALSRQVVKGAPDLLPHADTVPGSVVHVPDEEPDEARHRRLGFMG
jgi:hypothetical protein